MNTDQLIDRYWRAIVATTHKTQDMINDDAILLALNLAVTEAYDAGAALCHDLAAIIAAQKTIGPELRQAEVDRAQISTLNEWLADEEPALYHDPYTDTAQAMIAAIRKRDTQIAELQQEIAKVDADNSGLLLRLQKAEQGWAAAQADADAIALRIAQQPAAVHVNGNGAGALDPTPAAPTSIDWGRSNPAWRGLTEEELEDVNALATGAQTWRQINHDTRRELAQRVIWDLSEGGKLSMSQFDALRPSWMGTSTAIVNTLGCKWLDLVTPIPF